MDQSFIIKYTESFIKDYISIIKYFKNVLKLNNAVKKFQNNIDNCIINIKTMPFAYKKFVTKEKLSTETRRAEVGNFVILFNVIENDINFLRIVYTKRNLDKLDI